VDMTVTALDEAYEQLAATGPEFDGSLSNHGPMAADALLRLGHGAELQPWLSSYLGRLEDPPAARWPILDQDWREPLGDPARLGDWLALLTHHMRVDPWQEVLARWWPRLLPGAVGAATHGIIRTGHAVRALREGETAARRQELAVALGYWAARWQPVCLAPAGAPATPDLGGSADGRLAPPLTGGFRTRLAQLQQSPDWPAAVTSRHPVPAPAAVPAAIDALVDAAVLSYLRWAPAAPVMLVHAATAPRAVGLALRSLPPELWVASYQTAQAVTAAISAAYRPPHTGDGQDAGAPADVQPRDAPQLDPREVAAWAVGTGDEHAIKFTEVALESHYRGSSVALPAAARAASLLRAP
jgi:hypothetical protein